MPLTVVVVDDDVDYRHIVRYLLGSVSDTMVIVGEAADGEEALAVALRERPDIVITDLVMPRLNGVEADQAPQAGAAADEGDPHELLHRGRLPAHGR